MDKRNPFSFEQKQDYPRGINISRDDLKTLYRMLEKRTKEAAELQIENWERSEGQTDEDFEKLKDDIRNAYTVHITIYKPDNSSIGSYTEDTFLPENFPDRVTAIKFESGFKYKAISDLHPRNELYLNLDFGKLPLFDVSRLPNAATPNNSVANVYGQDKDWVNMVHTEIMEFINNRRSAREWLHKQSAYDALLFLFGFPVVFWTLYRIGPFFEKSLSDFSNIFISAVYVYFFLSFLYLIRFFFSYAQWVWPPNVIEGVIDPAKKHRLVIGGIILVIATDIGTSLFHFIF